jgi:uncharacterized membrane protein
MEYICLAAAMCSSAMLSIMSSLFGKKNPNAAHASALYSAVVTASACLTWGIICLCNGGVDLRAIGYSVLYGISYTLAMIGMFCAYQLGSTSLTAFIKQLSLIGVALWGFLFWNNTLTANIAIGLALIVAALYLCFKPDRKTKDNAISVKWCAFAFMLLTGNAGCSIIQKYQQLAFDGEYGNGFMLFGAAFAFLCSFAYAKKEHARVGEIKKASFIFPILGGISSAVLNLFILLLISSPLSESIIFPGIAVGGLIITMLFSVLAYGEKLPVHRWIGLGVGAVALVFLNL